MDKALAYSDITLVPKMSQVSSRSQCSTECDFLGRTFALPIIPANMKCSIDFDKAVWCSENDYFYVLHRFYDYAEVLEWVETHQHLKTISISIGVQTKDVNFLRDLVERGYRIDFLTIDIAHGHSVMMESILKKLTAMYGLCDPSFVPKIIAGNVTTAEAVTDLVNWGADAVKVGIGQGHVCTTRLQTGFGMPMVTCLEECVNYQNIPIIADGGISHYGDVAKAIALGADMVMVGSMFARCRDSPADTIGDGFRSPIKKRWYGSASEYNKGNFKHIEGIERIEPTNGLTYERLMNDWQEALQSAISYAGGTGVEDIKQVSYLIT